MEITKDTKLVDLQENAENRRYLARFINQAHSYFMNTREEPLQKEEMNLGHLFEIDVEFFRKFRDIGKSSLMKLKELKDLVGTDAQGVQTKINEAETKWDAIFKEMRRYFKEDDEIGKSVGFNVVMAENYLKKKFEAPEQKLVIPEDAKLIVEDAKL